MADDENVLVLWPELEKALKEGKREIVLSNIPESVLRLRNPGVNDAGFQSALLPEGTAINYIDFSRVGLFVVHPCISHASHLTQLILHSNSLYDLPEEIGDLSCLKYLDVSSNALRQLPSSISRLLNLQTLNAASNKLEPELPDLSKLSNLRFLNVSMNLLSVFPNVFPGEEGTSSLQVLELNSNELSKVPDELIQLADHLRTLDLSQNWLTELPFPIAYLSKLKQLSLAVNSFKDKRFYKIANDKRSKPSTIIEYLKKKCPSKPTIDKSGKKAAAAADSVVSANVNHPQIIIHFGHNSFSVKRESEVVRLRPYLICCLLKNVLLDEDKLKNTLVIQNKLHDSICQKRVAASIALHDASKIKPPLLYTALEPEALILTPLHRHTAITGKQFVQALTTEAELMRKQQKRNMYSPLHKYLHLVEKMDLYPCTVDSTGLVISFAPVTNSELTKMTTETNDIFIEVSSGESQTLCREIMDELVRSLFVGGISSPLTVEQIKVVQHGGNLLTAYPDKNDLQLEGISVRRELKEETKASESSTAEDV